MQTKPIPRAAMIAWHRATIRRARELREDGLGRPFAGFHGMRSRLYEAAIADAAAIRLQLAGK